MEINSNFVLEIFKKTKMILEDRTSHPNSYSWKCTQINYSQGNNKHLEAHVVLLVFCKTENILHHCHIHLWLGVLLGEGNHVSKVADVLKHPCCWMLSRGYTNAQSETNMLLLWVHKGTMESPHLRQLRSCSE